MIPKAIQTDKEHIQITPVAEPPPKAASLKIKQTEKPEKKSSVKNVLKSKIANQNDVQDKKPVTKNIEIDAEKYLDQPSMIDQLKVQITNEETFNTIEDVETSKDNHFNLSKESFFKFSKSSPINNQDVNIKLNYGEEQINQGWSKSNEPLFTEEDIRYHDVYHRLFKDSKIKSIKDTEFVEFLKI